MALLRTYGLYLAWLVAVVATLGSLGFSEVAHFIPCKLCWFQRVCMYPMSVVLGIAAYRGDRGVTAYALPLSVIGGVIAAYHVVLQQVPSLESITPCREGVPCTVEYLNWFGFLTIPMLSLTGFALITALLAVMRKAG